ncbi:MAG: alpha/beta hydrolase [Spirochaetaceae bacterium]|nr:MAG: alpha/beta hydrolase [Spirochaetaceae bacterium]
MLHGRDGTLQEFTFSIFDRVARKYDAIAFDRPGYGYSESNRADGLSTEVQAKLIHEALRTLGIENPILVGHSYGGAVLLQYLLDYPGEVRGAIILAGVSYVDEPPEGALFKLPNVPVVGPLITRTIALPVGRLLVSGIYDQAFSPATPPAGYVEEIASLYLRPSQFTATAAELATMYESVGRISPRYGEIEVPVTIIFGDSDRMLDWGEDGKRLDQALPDSQFILIKNAGHKVHHTHPKIVMDALDELSGDYVGQ